MEILRQAGLSIEALVSIDQARNATADQILADVAGNLTLYLEYIDIQPANEAREKLAVIVCAAFPAVDQMAVSKALEA